MKKIKTKSKGKFHKKILIFILSILVLFFVARLISPREIDDISPKIPCEQEYIEKSDILWVIPIYENIPISENKTWCKEILELNKTLGLHGIYHSYHEFEYYINETELLEAIQIFENCFNKTPTMFKAPNLALSKENKKIIKKHNLTIHDSFEQTIHKVYHCNDSGILSNYFNDVI